MEQDYKLALHYRSPPPHLFHLSNSFWSSQISSTTTVIIKSLPLLISASETQAYLRRISSFFRFQILMSVFMLPDLLDNLR
ncbi:unnamed protein product [Brassica napus]|uniref:(rape) hypothetical protein n=1 Tax=Brassica napus TaxID=3708 RepID=A0A816JDJ1_BRANA|nr:unnamed protein product [Brassica napus]